jgi:hypothetical protein
MLKGEILHNLSQWLDTFGLNNFITMDTGFNTAMAYWSYNQIAEFIMPNIRFFSVPTALPKEEKLNWAWKNFDTTLQYFKNKFGTISCVYIEDAVLWQENLTSLTSGSKGDLLTLSKLIGGYCNACRKVGIHYNLIPAQQWKGQMKKAATASRVYRELMFTSSNEHIIDAVGMGLSFINAWKVSK